MQKFTILMVVSSILPSAVGTSRGKAAPVLHLAFDEANKTSGSTLINSAGPNGSYQGATSPTDVVGAFGRGAHFTNDAQAFLAGSGAGGTLAETFNYQSAPAGKLQFTVASWVDLDSIPSTGPGYPILASNRDNSISWQLYANTSGGLRMGLPNQLDLDSTPGVLSATAGYQHIAMVFTAPTYVDNTDGGYVHGNISVQFYVNGEAAGSSTGNARIYWDYTHTKNWWAGLEAGTLYREFKGSLDEMWVYDTALTQGEVQQLMSTNAIPEPASLGLFVSAGLLMRRRRR